jgi:hypothetical protein
LEPCGRFKKNRKALGVEPINPAIPLQLQWGSRSPLPRFRKNRNPNGNIIFSDQKFKTTSKFNTNTASRPQKVSSRLPATAKESAGRGGNHDPSQDTVRNFKANSVSSGVSPFRGGFNPQANPNYLEEKKRFEKEVNLKRLKYKNNILKKDDRWTSDEDSD